MSLPEALSGFWNLHCHSAGQARSTREFTSYRSGPQSLNPWATAAGVPTPLLPHPSGGLSLGHIPHSLPELRSGKEPWLPTVITGLIDRPYWLPSLPHSHTHALPSHSISLISPINYSRSNLSLRVYFWGNQTDIIINILLNITFL